jgi:hypothetical protein
VTDFIFFFIVLMSLFVPNTFRSGLKVYTFNSASFGMAGVGGVIMITTKKRKRTDPTNESAFNSLEFQQFKIRGFSKEIPFPNSYESDQSVEIKPTLFCDGNAETQNGIYSLNVKIPQALKRVNLRVEGMTKDGLAFEKAIEIVVK